MANTPNIKRIRLHLICIAAAFGFAGATAPVSRAQEDAAVLFPIMEAWKDSQMHKFLAQIETALDQVGISMQNLETAQKTSDLIGSAFKTLTAVTQGYDDLETLYYAGKSLTSTCVYTYNWVKQAVTDGLLTPTEAANIMRKVDYIAMRSAYILDNAIQLFFTDRKDLKWDERILAIKKSIQELFNWQKELENEIKDKEEQAKDKAAEDALEEAMATIYGSKPEELTRFFKMPVTVKSAKEQMKETEQESAQDESSAVSSDKGDALNSVSNGLFGLRNHVLNFICAIIGLLAIFMSIPALIKIAHGERQSQDALYKLFMGTIAIIFIIQVFGRLIMSL